MWPTWVLNYVGVWVCRIGEGFREEVAYTLLSFRRDGRCREGTPGTRWENRSMWGSDLKGEVGGHIMSGFHSRLQALYF